MCFFGGTKVLFWDTKCFFLGNKTMFLTFSEVKGGLINCKIVIDNLEGQNRQGWGGGGFNGRRPNRSSKSSSNKAAESSNRNTNSSTKQQEKQQKQQKQHKHFGRSKSARVVFTGWRPNSSESGTQWKVSVRMQMLEHNLDGDMMDPDAFLHVHDVCFDRHSPGNKTFLRHLHIAHGRGLLWRRRFHVTCLTQVVNMHIRTLTRTDRQNLVVAVPPEALASTFQPMQSSAPQILCSGPYTCRKTCRLWPDENRPQRSRRKLRNSSKK